MIGHVTTPWGLEHLAPSTQYYYVFWLPLGQLPMSSSLLIASVTETGHVTVADGGGSELDYENIAYCSSRSNLHLGLIMLARDSYYYYSCHDQNGNSSVVHHVPASGHLPPNPLP